MELDRSGVVGTRSEVVRSRGYYRGSLWRAYGELASGSRPLRAMRSGTLRPANASYDGGPVSPTEGPQQVQILPPISPIQNWVKR